MATTRTFQDMLNDFLPNELLKEEMVKRDYLLNKVEKDDSWIGASTGASGNGGALVVPFKAAGASSVSYGQLTASNDIAEDLYVRGRITVQPELWGSMIFNHRDLMEHETVSEKNFLKILPDAVNDFMDYLKNVVSVNLLNGAAFAHATAISSANNGLMTVDRPDRFVIAQKVIIQGNGGNITAYVSTININTRVVLVVTTRGGATPVDFSANNLAVGANVWNDGAQSAPFSALRDALLSAANGGSTNLYSVAKTAYTYLQAINVDGATVTAANIVEKCFDAYTQTRKFGKGNPTDIVMSYTNLGYIMKVIEASKGAYNVVAGSQKASQFGWTEITIGSVTNQALKFVGVQEMDDDIIMFIDWRGLKFYSNGFFRKRKSPDGVEYFEIRAQSGYQYIIDICLFGDLVVHRPSYMGIMYGIAIPAGS